jgi:ATP-dependent RNA helicase SUPV3L1/SUV3
VLARGSSIALPDVRLENVDELGAGAKSRLLRRALACARDVAASLLGDVRMLATADASASLRGFVHRLEQWLGTVRYEDVSDVASGLTDSERAALLETGLKGGTAVFFRRAGLVGGAVKARLALAHAFYTESRLTVPRGGSVSFVVRGGVNAHAYTAVG